MDWPASSDVGAGRANCGRRRNGADRRDSCAPLDSVHVGLATTRHGRVYAHWRPVRAVWPALAESAGVGAVR